MVISCTCVKYVLAIISFTHKSRDRVAVPWQHCHLALKITSRVTKSMGMKFLKYWPASNTQTVYVQSSLQILPPKHQWGHGVIETGSLHPPHRVILGPSPVSLPHYICIMWVSYVIPLLSHWYEASAYALATMGLCQRQEWVLVWVSILSWLLQLPLGARLHHVSHADKKKNC